MSVSIMSKVFYTSYPELTCTQKNGRTVTISPVVAKIVMLAISDSSDDFGENSYNGFDRLATKTSLHRKTVIRATRALVQSGHISISEVSTYGTNNFKINMDKLGEAPTRRAKRGRPANTDSQDIGGVQSDIGGVQSDIRGVTPPDSSLSIHNHPPQQKLHPVPSSPAIKESQTMTTIEQHKKRTEEALFASMTNDTTGYAHYPEQVRQVVLRVATLWNLRAPERPRGGRGKQYAYWIESCRALQDACGEFGVEMLDKLRDDFVAYMAEHGGVAPHTVSSPNSLVNSAAAKAALLRGGNTAPMWGSRLTGKPQARQTTLDV